MPVMYTSYMLLSDIPPEKLLQYMCELVFILAVSLVFISIYIYWEGGKMKPWQMILVTLLLAVATWIAGFFEG